MQTVFFIKIKKHVSEQVKTLEGQCTQQGQELSDVQARLTQEEHREEEMRKETFTLRQRVLESDAGREAALKEVQQTNWHKYRIHTHMQ